MRARVDSFQVDVRARVAFLLMEKSFFPRTIRAPYYWNFKWRKQKMGGFEGMKGGAVQMQIRIQMFIW